MHDSELTDSGPNPEATHRPRRYDSGRPSSAGACLRRPRLCPTLEDLPVDRSRRRGEGAHTSPPAHRSRLRAARESTTHGSRGWAGSGSQPGKPAGETRATVATSTRLKRAVRRAAGSLFAGRAGPLPRERTRAATPRPASRSHEVRRVVFLRLAPVTLTRPQSVSSCRH